MDKFSLMQAVTVDFTPTINAVWGYVMELVPVIAVAMLAWVAKYAGLTKWVDNQLLHDMLQRAVNYGVARADSYKENFGPIKVEIANQVLADALKYAVTYSPDLIKKYKLTPEDVVRLLMAKLPEVEGPLVPGTAEKVVDKAIAEEEKAVEAAKV